MPDPPRPFRPGRRPRAGYDPAALDREKLGRLLRQAARGSVSTPIHELFREPPAPIDG